MISMDPSTPQQNEPGKAATKSLPGKMVNAAGKRICCACKETRAARDDCIVLNGEEKCKHFVEAHNQCLRSEGFDVS